jgi:hypothetical protein
MQALRLIVPGSYWDSQIYQGRLYLFNMDGSLFALDWDETIQEYGSRTGEQFALSCAFQRGDYLYGSQWDLFFTDREVIALIKSKFDSLASKPLTLDHSYIDRFRNSARPNPMPFPHSDCIVYDQQMYVSAPSGVFRSTCNKRTVGPISGRPVKLWDMPVNGVSAGWGCLAMAAGSEGLWQFNMDQRWANSYSQMADESFLQISQLNCSACEWSYYSIFCSSYESGGYLADFSYAQPDMGKETSYEDDELLPFPGRSRPSNGFQSFPDRVREFEEIVPATRIFDSAGYSWGCRDKVCQSSDGTIHVAKYKPWADDSHDRFRRLEDLRLTTEFGPVVSAALATFGTVIECEDGLIVLHSDDEQTMIPGEPVNWRVFPRSKHYSNHLHVIHDDRLEVWSFNHDYFLNQEKKRLGIRITL